MSMLLRLHAHDTWVSVQQWHQHGVMLGAQVSKCCMTHNSTAFASARPDARGSSFKKSVSILTCAWNGKVGLGMGPRACSISCRPDYWLDVGKSRVKAHFCVLCCNLRVATFVFEDLWAWFLDVRKSRWWCWKCFGNTMFGHFEGIPNSKGCGSEQWESFTTGAGWQVQGVQVSRCDSE